MPSYIFITLSRDYPLAHIQCTQFLRRAHKWPYGHRTICKLDSSKLCETQIEKCKVDGTKMHWFHMKGVVFLHFIKYEFQLDSFIYNQLLERVYFHHMWVGWAAQLPRRYFKGSMRLKEDDYRWRAKLPSKGNNTFHRCSVMMLHLCVELSDDMPKT